MTALDRLTMDVGPGVTGLVGSNGAGKSTLIKILLGLAPATEGRAEVLGLDVSTHGGAIRERVGYMPEHDCLPPDVSATEFVVHMARMSGLPPTAARERTADTLRHVGLYEERYRPMGGYSTGMKQRVKLAQALVHDPDLVFLDEPTNGLDPVGRDDMLGLIRRIHADFGISVLVTSHLLGELERTCDHVVVIDGGSLLRSSSTRDFTGATTTLAVEVTDTEAHPDGTAALLAALRDRGVTAARAASSPALATACSWRRPTTRPATWSATSSSTSASAWSAWSRAAGTSPTSSRRTAPASARTSTHQSLRPPPRRSPSDPRREAVGHDRGQHTDPQHRVPEVRRPAPRPRPRPARPLLPEPARRLRPRTLGQVQGAADAPLRRDVPPGGHHGRGHGHRGLKTLPVDYTRYAVVMQAVIGLYVASQAPQSVSRDLRFKTVPLYFSRPVERVDYVLAKYAAMASALFLLTAVPLLVLYAGALLAELDFADQTAGFGQGMVSVALLSLLFAGIGLVVSAVTPRRGFGIAAVIAVFTITYGAVSTVQAIAFQQGNTDAVGWIGLFSPITLIDGVQTAFLGATSAYPGGAGPSTAGGAVHLLVVLALIAGCYGLLMRRYRKAGL
ncbi:ATP-binding cassette domain-containing protein [Actinomadura keratinilytica]